MVLDYLGIQVAYGRLLKLLKIETFGASAYNLNYLSSLGVTATIDIRDMTVLRQLLQAGSPLITLVRTGELSYWSQNTNHVVVVIGYEDDAVFINDPAFAQAPIQVSIVKFERAWLAFDYLSIVLSPVKND
ncbi:MAG: hypothetical protein BroJett015_42520 [Chloroflexota bacterium]|nr:MAG: hypothetical protein BroJett015_42520 [Chloroflexota bacterium]